MAAPSCAEQAPRPRALLRENAAKPTVLSKATRRSTQADRSRVPSAQARVPIEAAHRRPRKPRPPTHSGPFLLARRVHRPRSKSDPAIRLGLAQKQLLGGSPLLQAGRCRHSRQRPLRAVPGTLGGPPLGTGLAPASSWPPCPSSATRPGSSTAWVGKPPTC